MADLLELSSRIIDSGSIGEPTNRITLELSEIGDHFAVIESFSHVVVLRSGDGLVLFDTSGALLAEGVVRSLRAWTSEPISTIVYTHGHIDHVGGSGALLADSRSHGHRDPTVVGHAALMRRFARYELTNGYNEIINRRQFSAAARPAGAGGSEGASGLGIGGTERFLPADTVRPSMLFEDRLGLRVGDRLIELRHDLGETDDHVWAWLPELRAICAGDFFIWNFPNAGNPQKVQRYPAEWAGALRKMAALEPELLLPAHGLPIAGRERIATVLDDVATALERLVAAVLEQMNAGERLDAIVHSVSAPEDLLSKPYLRPLYDEPEFVVRNVWRRYGGWWDGDPAHLKPARAAALASEVARLAGGAPALARRGVELAGAGDLRLACHLVEMAAQASPEDPGVHAARAEVYERRRKAELSLMAKGIFAHASRESSERAGPHAAAPN